MAQDEGIHGFTNDQQPGHAGPHIHSTKMNRRSFLGLLAAAPLAAVAVLRMKPDTSLYGIPVHTVNKNAPDWIGYIHPEMLRRYGAIAPRPEAHVTAFRRAEFFRTT